jgi:hypothetical protein
MTGIDPKERDNKKLIEDLKFGRKKNIDQAIFIEMYKTQIGKNALYEVSRFCFENLRRKNGVGNNFADYWSNYQKDTLHNLLLLDELNDSGNPVFGTIQNSDDKDKIYEDIFKSIQGTNGASLSPELLSTFFFNCGSLIVPLCSKFEDNQKVSLKDKTISNVNTNGSTVGAAACLTQNRIREYRKALTNADKIAAQFEEMKNDEKSLNLLITGLKGEPVKMYGDRQDPTEETIDDLTNYTSKDVLEGGYSKDANFEQKTKACLNRPELAQCEGIISEAESFEKAKHTLEMELTLKREVEMARIRSLVSKGKDGLINYLTENGYQNILRMYNEGTLSDHEIEEKVGQSFEAKKIAILEQMNAKVGKRQVAKSTVIGKSDVTEVIKETKEERARMAQVVLFNNIISSHLEIMKDNKIIGRNLNVWKREEKSLESSNIDSKLFKNLSDSHTDSKGVGQENSIAEFGILDTLLGK